MKYRIAPKTLIAVVGVAALTFSVKPIFGQNSVSTTVTTRSQTAPALSYGSGNVLKLAQADVGDEIIIAYIEKSGQGYGSLGASEIIYLRDHGVSDRVLATMLAQEKKSRDDAVAKSAAPIAAAPAPATPVVTAPATQQTYSTPVVTYYQPAPAPLIVMRDSSPRLVDYGIYSRHYYNGCYPNYGYGYRSYYSNPRVSFSFGFGGHYGGFRSGYCR